MRRLRAWLTALVTGRRRGVARELAWEAVLDGRVVPTFHKGHRDMLLLTNVQKVTLTVQPLDAYGNPARVDGAPSWATSDAALGGLAVSADGLSAVFTTSGLLGVVQITVRADADLGTGVRMLSGTLDIQIEPSEAATLTIIAGVPEPR